MTTGCLLGPVQNPGCMIPQHARSDPITATSVPHLDEALSLTVKMAKLSDLEDVSMHTSGHTYGEGVHEA